MRYIYAAVVLAILTSSCSKNSSGSGPDTDTDTLSAATYLDVSYGTDAQQKMDIYLPAKRNAKTRLLVIAHGGGWHEGDKADLNASIIELQKRLPHYAFANVNYRLATSTSNLFPTQENDMRELIMFLKNKASGYHISTDFVYLGVSAGAHLLLLQAFKHNDDLKPKGIVSFFGPTDLKRLYENSDHSINAVLRAITNATLESNPQIFEQSSPINYVSAGGPPILMLHGDQDVLVPLEQAQLLRTKLDSVGIYNKLVVYPGQGHGWVGPDLIDSFNQIETFIKGLEN